MRSRTFGPYNTIEVGQKCYRDKDYNDFLHKNCLLWRKNRAQYLQYQN
jgi:hypothetical protein